MKRCICAILTVIFLMVFVQGAFAHPADLSEYIFVVKNDEAVIFGEERPFTINGYTYVPDYILRDWLEVTTDWSESEHSMTIARGLMKVKAYEKSERLAVPSGSRQMKFYRSNDVLMLPLEPIASALRFGVSYIHEGRLLRITNGRETLTNEEVFDKFIPQINYERKNFVPFFPVGAKRIFITFDDGPDPENTPRILDILAKHNVKATFFMLAGNMESYPDIVKRIKAEGHAVALHGVTHSQSRFYANAWSPTLEMEQANNVLKSITGDGTSIVRVPYGSSPSLTNIQYRNLKGAGFLMWDWNIDSQDSLKANVSTQTIYNNAIAGLNGQDVPVMLFHDKTNVVNCLDSILTYVRSRGYRPVAITDSDVPYNWKEQ